MTALDLNRRLAELLGWSEIIVLGGALLGKPPAGVPSCRNQARVPDWTGDWRDCGPLIAEHKCYPHMVGNRIRVGLHRERGRAWNLLHWATATVEHEESIDKVMREAIVSAVIAKLEAGQ